MKFIYRLLLIFVFIFCLVLVIGYARGYQIDFEKKVLSSTGILAVTSTPKAAKIYVNGELKGVTDSNLTLSPGQYTVEIKKDGYTNWAKKLTLKGELVLSLDALLFPLNPSLSPLTNLGVKKAISLNQTDRILLFTDTGDETKDGIYLFEGGKRPFLPLSPMKRIVLKKNLTVFTDFTSVDVYLSPDLKEVIIESPKEKTAYLLSLEEENTNVFDITTSKDALLVAWKSEKEKEYLKILETFPKEIAKVASDSFHIIAFSPNETRLLYSPEKPVVLPSVITPPLIASNQTPDVRKLQKDHLYVYDKKEDRNFEISLLPTTNYQLSTIQWYSDSKHLILNENNKISVVDYDGTNKQTIYSGPFDNSFFNATGDGGLIVLLNLNPEANKFPDLYAVGIK